MVGFLLVLLISWRVFCLKNECVNDIMVGEITISGEHLYVAEAGGNWGGVNLTSSSIRLEHNARIYVAKDCPTDWKPDMFRGYKLLGGWLSYTVDLSKVGCACNAAVYLVMMPGYDQNGNPDPTKGKDYYCDANQVGGEYCPEIDLQEANNHAMAITPHKCNDPQNKHFCCDRGGCARNLYKNIDHRLYGPGDEFLIDTRSPFSMNFTFHEDGSGRLDKMETKITGKDGKSHTIVHDEKVCGNGYLESLTDALKTGFVLVASNWGVDGAMMSWLDVPPCDQSVKCNNGAFTFYDIQVHEAHK